MHPRHRRQSRHRRVHGGRRQEAGGASAIGLLRGTAAQIATRLLTGGAQILLLAQLSRALPSPSLGKLLFYLTFFLFLESIADLGISPTALAKAGAEPQNAAAWIRQARRARWKIALPACLVIPVVALLYGDSPWIPAALGSLELLILPLGLGGIAFQKDLNYLPLSLARVGGAAATLVLSLGMLVLGIDAWQWHLAAFSAGTILTNLWLWALTRTKEVQTNTEPTPSLLASSWPLGLSNAAQQAYFGAGSFLVRQSYPENRFWEFGLPFRAYVFALMIPQYLTGTALPLLAAHAAHDKAAYRALRGKLLFGLLAIGIPAAALAAIAGPQILAFVFGPGKEAAAESLRWLALAGLFVVGGAVGTSCLVARGRNRTLLLLSAWTAALSIPASWWLVQARGPAGAAMGCAIAEGFVAAASWWLLLRSEREERRGER